MSRILARSRSLTVTLVVLASTLIWAQAARDAEAKADKRVVAVLYFDNNTGDAAYDVFQKGLADMMITDLSSVRGITVVEREKLQALIDEIALQKTKYFDNKTAIKLGKGLGARYAVTGAIHALAPRLRIDVRLIDIASGEVVVTSKVTGAASELFELEQELVARFVQGMDQTFSPSARPATRVPDVDVLLDYSRAVDLADKGLYREASDSMQKVISAAPTFVLARVQREHFLKRLKEAGARRNVIRGELGAGLATKTERFLDEHDIGKLDKDAAKTYLAYRGLRGRLIQGALDNHLAKSRGVRVILEGHEAKAKAFMEAYHANTVLMLRELDIYAGRHTQTYPNGVVHLDTYFQLPADDARSAKAAGIDVDIPRDAVSIGIELGRFLLLGEHENLAGESQTVAPPLAELDARYRKLGYGHLRDAWARADAAARTQDNQVYAAIRALEAHADALFLRGKSEQGIAKLQEILDRYPTSPQYPRYEKEIKKHLGLAHDHELASLDRYAKGLKQCQDMDLRVGSGPAFSRRVRLQGLAGVHAVVAEIEKACKGNDKAKSFWPYLYSHAALIGARQESCKLFDDYMARYLAAGGSKSDAAGYRKNYSKCPAP